MKKVIFVCLLVVTCLSGCCSTCHQGSSDGDNNKTCRTCKSVEATNLLHEIETIQKADGQ